MVIAGQLLVAMVGLPARGKTFVARSIARHLDWVGLRCKIFSHGEHRRKEVGVFQPAAYFDQGEIEVVFVYTVLLKPSYSPLSPHFQATNPSKSLRKDSARDVMDAVYVKF